MGMVCWISMCVNQVNQEEKIDTMNSLSTKGDLTFKEESKAYGLDVLGLSVHAAFFDADLDGDLDCYVLNNSLRSVGGYDLIKDQRLKPDPNGEGK
jgi:hypothetical protein